MSFLHEAQERLDHLEEPLDQKLQDKLSKLNNLKYFSLSRLVYIASQMEIHT